MKCPKCGYQSFNHLLTCKKCGRDLTELQAKLSFGQVVVPDSSPLGGTVRTTGAPASKDSEGGSLEDFFRDIPEPPPEDTAVARPLESPAPPVAKPPSTSRNHEELPETDMFPDGEETEDAFPFPFDSMDADLDALQREDEDNSEPFVLDTPFEEQEELDLGISPQEEQGEKPEKAERDDVRGPAESDPEDFSFSAPSDGQESEQDEDFFFSFEELNSELTGWKDIPSLPEGTKPEDNDIDLTPVRDGRKTTETAHPPKTAGPDAAAKPQRDEDLPTPPSSSQPSTEGLPEAAAAQTEPAFIPSEDIDWQTVEDTIPGGMEQSPEPALGRRFSALLTDLGILALVFALFLLAGEMVRVPTAAQWFRFNADILFDLAAPYFVLLFTLCFGYFTLFHYLVGQTPGKMLKGLRVENPSGDPPSLAQAFLRSTGGLAMVLPAGLGVFSLITDRGRRGWNDRLANTRVVNKAAEDREA
jgi:uncharacterized RDD family membrane protein YckC